MELIERFLDYVGYDTQSSETADTTPSTPKQLVFAEHLKNQLEELGFDDVYLDAGKYRQESSYNRFHFALRHESRLQRRKCQTAYSEKLRRFGHLAFRKQRSRAFSKDVPRIAFA